MAAEPGAGSDAAGREEPADLDDCERPERSRDDDYDDDYERDDYDEDRNADRCRRLGCLTNVSGLPESESRAERHCTVLRV